MALAHQHDATITKGTVIGRRYHAQCACGTAGDFSTKQAAKGFINGHFKVLQGINTKSLKDETPDSFSPEPSAAWVSPPVNTAHVGGVGTMPKSHAQKSVPPVPPPPPQAPKAVAEKDKKTGPPPPPPPPPASKK